MKSFKGAADRRDLFLDLAQQRALLAAELDGMSTLEVAKLVGTSVMMIEKYYGHLVHATARERLRLDPHSDEGQSSAISTFGQIWNCDGVGEAGR